MVKKLEKPQGLQGPQVRIIPKSAMPPALGRGRHSEAMIITMPFWQDLVNKLKNGLNPAEAIEVNLGDSFKIGDKEIPKKKLAARIRYQFVKEKFNKKFTLLVPGTGNSLFVVDNETAAMLQ